MTERKKSPGTAPAHMMVLFGKVGHALSWARCQAAAVSNRSKSPNAQADSMAPSNAANRVRATSAAGLSNVITPAFRPAFKVLASHRSLSSNSPRTSAYKIGRQCLVFDRQHSCEAHPVTVLKRRPEQTGIPSQPLPWVGCTGIDTGECLSEHLAVTSDQCQSEIALGREVVVDAGRLDPHPFGQVRGS